MPQINESVISLQKDEARSLKQQELKIRHCNPYPYLGHK